MNWQKALPGQQKSAPVGAPGIWSLWKHTFAPWLG
jgi:hypothetical protein